MSFLNAFKSKIYFDRKSYKKLSFFLDKNKYLSSIFILVDEKTKIYCLPYLLENIPFLSKAKIIKISSGEDQKNLTTCLFIWNFLSKNKADRNSFLINLGGGVICDMGAFVASSYKRGISFVHIPTTLLSLIDASIGGKTGINLGVIKNQIGNFAFAKFVFVDTYYLKTLPKREILSGLAELIKISLVCDKKLFKEVKKINMDRIQEDPNFKKLIRESILLKNRITKKDPLEKGIRKILNFGHTIGHSLESYFLNSKEPLLHGEAIALGMVAESYLSYQINHLEKKEYEEIRNFIFSIYSKVELAKNDFDKILSFMAHDKKNYLNKFQFVLLQKIGKCSFDHQVSLIKIKESLSFIE